LGEIHAQPRLCVPELIQALGDSDASVRLSATHALGMFGPDAQAAIPLLTSLTNNPVITSGTIPVEGLQARFEASRALEKINPRGEDSILAVDPLKVEPSK
jgi:HEAT repeat protein